MSEFTPVREATIDVLLFSLLREQLGTATLTLVMDAPEQAGALLRRLAASYPSVRDTLACTRVAVNQEYVQMDHLIRPGDEVALITPVSGG